MKILGQHRFPGPRLTTSLDFALARKREWLIERAGSMKQVRNPIEISTYSKPKKSLKIAQNPQNLKDLLLFRHLQHVQRVQTWSENSPLQWRLRNPTRRLRNGLADAWTQKGNTANFEYFRPLTANKRKNARIIHMAKYPKFTVVSGTTGFVVTIPSLDGFRTTNQLSWVFRDIVPLFIQCVSLNKQQLKRNYVTFGLKRFVRGTSKNPRAYVAYLLTVSYSQPFEILDQTSVGQTVIEEGRLSIPTRDGWEAKMHGWHLPKMANFSIYMEGIAQNSTINRQKQPKIAKIRKKLAFTWRA